jgi:hypothetical protein
MKLLIVSTSSPVSLDDLIFSLHSMQLAFHVLFHSLPLSLLVPDFFICILPKVMVFRSPERVFLEES